MAAEPSSTRDGRVAGKVIVVTGAAGGQGTAMAEALAAEGAEVIAADLEEPAAAEHRHPRRLDVADAQAWSGLAAELEERFGRVDGLINNAGTLSRGRIGEVEMPEWDRAFAVNVTGAMLGIQALLPLMGPGASIVNVCSVAALTGHYTVAYAASKWALRGLTFSIAPDLGPRGIRVNAVHPGFIETPMTATSGAEFKAAHAVATPLARPGQPSETAAAMVFLMSDESSYVHGADLAIDGGFVNGAAARHLAAAVA